MQKQKSKCYAAQSNECSGPISREHYISDSILQFLSGDSSTLAIEGLPWLKNSRRISLSPNNLAAKILCKGHNETLSPLDEIASQFFRTIHLCMIGGVQGKVNVENLRFDFNGRDIENWMLKVVCGGIATGLYGKSGKDVPIYLVEVLFGKIPWPSTINLYTTEKKQYVVPEQPHVGFSFMGDLKSGFIAGLICNYFALDLILTLSHYPDVPGVKHPRKLVFVGDIREIEIKLNW
jgi:hypothetical protein